MTAMLILKPASKSRLSDEWDADDFDVFADEQVVGRIAWTDAAPSDQRWFWLLRGRWAQQPSEKGYAATSEVAIAASRALLILWTLVPGIRAE
jgi:hypothetical protein